MRNVKQIHVSKKVYIDTAPGIDTEYGRQYSPISTSHLGGASQNTTLDMHVVSAVEEMANMSPHEPNPRELRSSFQKPLKWLKKLECLVQPETTNNGTTPIQGSACAYRCIQIDGTTYLVRLKEFCYNL
jgi:hypothetical protein